MSVQMSPVSTTARVMISLGYSSASVLLASMVFIVKQVRQMRDK